MILRLHGLEADCIIGERPEERTRVQTLRLDVELVLSESASETDALCDTLDYAALADRIRGALAAARCQMIERAARVVHEVCCADARVSSARVSVTKSGAVPRLAAAEVVYDGR